MPKDFARTAFATMPMHTGAPVRAGLVAVRACTMMAKGIVPTGMGTEFMTLIFGRWARAIVAMVLAVAIAGCYFPIRFDAEIEISRYGAYSMHFDGYLVDVQLYDGMRQEKFTEEELEKRIARIETDLKRDSSTKIYEYIKEGHFRVNWQKSGDILRSKMVSFVRRNENILSILYVKKKGLISVQATPIAKETAKRLINMGLDMRGQLRVKTDARVASHNAHKILKHPTTGQKIFIWDVKTALEPSPKISIVFR